MARKKSTRKKGLDIQATAINALAIAGGAAASGVVDSLLLSKITSLSPLLKGVVKMAAGAIIPPLVGNSFVEKFGDGMIAVGAYQTLHTVLPTQIPAIAGIPAPYPRQVTMNGTVGNLPTVSGPVPTVSGIAGDDHPDFSE